MMAQPPQTHDQGKIWQPRERLILPIDDDNYPMSRRLYFVESDIGLQPSFWYNLESNVWTRLYDRTHNHIIPTWNVLKKKILRKARGKTQTNPTKSKVYETPRTLKKYRLYQRCMGKWQRWLSVAPNVWTSNGSWCMGIKGEMSGTVCLTLHEICIYIYIWVVYSLCFFCCLFITVTWWYVWYIEWASGNQEEVQACLVTLWLFIISCYNLYKTTLGLLCSWFENNPHFHKYSMDFHV